MLNETEKNTILKNRKRSNKLISPINYSWKAIFKIMNKIKSIWRMNKFDNIFTLNTQTLNKFIYTNLKYCNKIPNLRLKNDILESDINSFFQTNLFDYLKEEQKIFDYFDNMFKNNKYIPKKDEDDEILFGEFIIKYKDLFYSIQNNKKSMRQLKKLRWYLIMDEDNFFLDDNKNNYFNMKNSDFFLDFSKEVENNNDSFDEIETKMLYDEFNKNEKDKILDNLEEIQEKNVINDELIDKLLKNENVPFFYIIKLIYLSIKIFCKATICHLLNYYSNIEENKTEDGKYLINEYLLCFNNFVDSCILINNKCTNINVAMNYLYDALFEKYPNFPKFSIFRMCIRIWFTEANTHLIGQNTLLSQIKDKLASIFSKNLKEELYNKIKNNRNNTYNSKSVNFAKSKSFGLNSSYMLFKSDNPTSKKNDYLSPFDFGSKYITNTYNNSDKQYKILDKGLSIINDTFSNEYSVYILNLSTIDTNSFYHELLSNFNNSIKYYIDEIFNSFLNDSNFNAKDIIDNIFNYFDNYFFKSQILPKLRKNLYEKVYLELKNNLLEYSKNKYLDSSFFKNKDENNFISKSISTSTKSNMSANMNCKSLLKSSIFAFNNDLNFDKLDANENNEINYEIYKKEIINYIKKNIEFNNKSINNEIERKVEEINEHINIYDLFHTIQKWYEDHLNSIKKNDRNVMEKLIGVNIEINISINIPLKFNQLKRYLLSYSLQYDWAFIKKVKNIENYSNKNNINKDDDIEMTINNNNLEVDYFNNLDNIGNLNNDNELGLNYFNNLDNIGNVNNNNNVTFNLRNSYFDY